MAEKNRIPLLALAMLLTAAVGPAWPLGTEHPGTDPIGANWGLSGPSIELGNAPGRFFWYEVNGSPTFFYRGDTERLNRSLQLLALLPGPREVVLMPAPGEGRSFDGKPFPCDWFAHPGGEGL